MMQTCPHCLKKYENAPASVVAERDALRELVRKGMARIRDAEGYWGPGTPDVIVVPASVMNSITTFADEAEAMLKGAE